MGLQLFSNRKWEDDSFNFTNVPSVLRNAKQMLWSRSPFIRPPFQPTNAADAEPEPLVRIDQQGNVFAKLNLNSFMRR